MSEYQYYEFQAVDRPLTQAEMAELRALSTRAAISPTRFQNVYNFGDFKGNPLALMERYFDAFVYVANWGTHWCMLRLPRRALDPDVARRYCDDETATLHVTRDHVILEFRSEDQGEAGWVEDEEAEGWLPALVSLRAELASGDLRALYLAWLASLYNEALEDDELELDDDAVDSDDETVDPDAEVGLDDDTVEPPVPPGLGNLSASLEALAEFLRVDRDLIAVTAERSPDLPPSPPSADLENWLRALPESEKDDLLLRLVQGGEPHLRAELLRRFGATGAPGIATGDARTVGELLARAKERAETRRREEAAREAAERARREREQAVARVKYLESLVGREEQLWREVEALVEAKRPKEYDLAVQLLKDLRDLSARQQRAEAFAARLGPLRERYAKRPALLDRLDRAGLEA
jgi:hypothetical protein